MAFNEQKYKDIFDKRFGAGSFDAGLSSARNIGATKAQAQFAKQEYNQRMKELEKAQKEALKKSQKKTFEDALSYWNQPENKAAARKDGAYRNAENIRNDPRLKAQIEEQGFKVQDYIDAMFNATSDGEFRSEREAKEFTKQVGKKAKTNKSNPTQDLINQYSAPVENKKKGFDAIKKKDDKPKNGFLKKAGDFFTSKDVDGDGDRDGLLGLADRFLAPISKGATEAIFPGNQKAMEQHDIKKYGSVQNPVTKAAQVDRGLETTALNTVGALGAFAAPYSRGYKAAEFAVNKIPKLANIANPYARKVVTGGIAGGMAEGAISGVNELANPDAFNIKDHAIHTGLGIAGGAVLDPALFGLGRLARKGFEKAIPGDFPKFDGQVSGDLLERLQPLRRSPISPSHPTANRLLPDSYNMPDGRNVRMTASDKAALNREPSLADRLKRLSPEREMNDFSFGKQTADDFRKPVNQYGVEIPFDPVEHAPASYWRKRYEDFAQHVQRNYDPNQMTQEGLEDLWSQFARYDEPVNLEQLVELAYRNVDEAPVLDARNFNISRPAVSKNAKRIMGVDDTALNIQPETTSKIDPWDSLRPTKKTGDITPENSIQQRFTQALNPSKKVSEPFESITPSFDRLQKPSIANAPIVKGTPIDGTPIQIDNPKEIVKRQINKDGNKEKNKLSFEKLYTQWVDDLHPLDKATKDLGGKDLAFGKNPYNQARLARGVAGKAETYLREGVFSDSGEKIGKSLQEIIKPIEKKMDDFLAYSTSKRALDYDQKGLTAGIKPKDVEGMSDRQLADAAIRQIEAESPEIKAVHEELLQYNNRLMDDLVDAGVLSKESVESIRTDNPNYIPMFRVQDKKVRGFEPLTNPKRTFANLGEPLKKRTGSEREIINPIESIVKNTYLTLNMAERNKVGTTLLDLIEQSGDNAWGRVVKSEKGMSVDDVGRALDDANAQLTDGNADAIDSLFKGEGNKVYVYKDGQKIEMELQEDLYKAMLSLDTQKQNFFINILATPARTLRAGAVLSPDFGPVNIFRDQLSAMINTKYGFIPFVDMAKGLKHVLKKDNVYLQWKGSGGANSVLSTLDREYLQQDLRKMVKQSLGQKVKHGIKNPVSTALEPLRKVSEITEEATRVGEFAKGLKKGASPKEAALASRDLIDFSRAGTLGRQYNQVTAFFNAAVQSVDKLARTFKENPVGAMSKATLGITLPTIAAYYANRDKEWYKEIPQRDRDLFWHFEIGDQIYKLPKPFEAGIIFGTSFERMLDYLETSDPKAFEDFGKTVKDAFTPNWIPTAILPWIEVYGNKNMHFDSPIVPRREDGLLPEDQYGPYQSELSKGLGKLMKQSPRKIEHVYKGYTGGLGRYALMGSDAAASQMGVERPILPDRGLAGAPILNRFVVKNLEGSNQSVNDFYKRMDKLRRENLSAKKNNPDHENTDTLKAINKLSRDIGELQAYKRDIIDDRSMSAKQKTEQIKRVDRAITELAKTGNRIP